MLAYVLWHRARDDVRRAEYEAAHRAFHEALWAAAVPGLLEVGVYRSPGLSWLPSASGVYEDWQLLDHSGRLDILNDAAIAGSRQPVHDRIAAMAGAGTAGLYLLRLGQPVVPAVAHWFSKPERMPYADFLASLEPHCRGPACLWGRRMTLGPSPEFCLHSSVPVELDYPSEHVPLEKLLHHAV